MLGADSLSLVYSLLDHKEPREELTDFEYLNGRTAAQFGSYLSKLHSPLLPQ